jgi:hypothetical protein
MTFSFTLWWILRATDIESSFKLDITGKDERSLLVCAGIIRLWPKEFSYVHHETNAHATLRFRAVFEDIDFVHGVQSFWRWWSLDGVRNHLPSNETLRFISLLSLSLEKYAYAISMLTVIMKLDKYIMAFESFSTSYFLNPSHQPVCLHVYSSYLC